MADSTLDSELFVLINPWGPPTIEPAGLLDGIIGSSHHNVSAAAYPVGSVVRLWNDDAVAGKPGYSYFVYLQAVANADVAIAAKQFLVPDSATIWYKVTNDPDDAIMVTGSPLFGVALSAMTTLYYGWFWCGGVCPESHVSDLGGNFATEGNVAAGAITVHDLAADAIGLGPRATLEAFSGFALAADA